jgi:hypothetical protein
MIVPIDRIMRQRHWSPQAEVPLGAVLHGM